MNVELLCPFLGVNDDEAVLTNCLKPSGSQVQKGELVCLVETSKTSLEVEVNKNGFIYFVLSEGNVVEEGKLIAVIAEDRDFDLQHYLKTKTGRESQNEETISITKKAEILLKRYNIDSNEIKNITGRIDEKVVNDFLLERSSRNRRIGLDSVKRIGVIGGVSGGGALITIDAIADTVGQIATCIFDENPVFHGQSVLGVPVVGGIDSLDKLILDGKVDAVVIAFNRDLKERQNVYEVLSSKGVPFVNVIAKSAQIRSCVTIGTGNVILSGVYVGACSVIGNNNFISANVYLEHGAILGDSNAFGPLVSTSGNVTIGSSVRFGTGIFVEPEISIGDYSSIASGSIITKNVSRDAQIKGTGRS